MITIYELKRRNIANGGMFFERRTMRFCGDTLKNFKISRDVDPTQVIVSRVRKTSAGGMPKSWRFNKETGRFVAPFKA